ncbi:phosphoribosylformylglycinamidine synthase [Planoprotostelium fungivorum]|uniref:phosphoribosylformylglycinamidine synthase n=1 Tax=Planoprotostelium fungivorum TaxID=1890364 RepID=A0A2P6NN58_9EUKA|nr:phosphoribosylformylglycinamidine synthase [Planoprotostelium fungivorum]
MFTQTWEALGKRGTSGSGFGNFVVVLGSSQNQMTIQRAFRRPGVATFVRDNLAARVKSGIELVDTEQCFYIEAQNELTAAQWEVLSWLLSETFEPEGFSVGTSLLQVGPRLSFSTAWSTNAVSICHACGLKDVVRVERSIRYLLRSSSEMTTEQTEAFLNLVQDRMTEAHYTEPLQSFETGAKPQPVRRIEILERGRVALDEINDEMGLAFDEHDMEMYINLFKELGRNPTNVELFDLAQSNSEHSRHWYFRGRMVIDGDEKEETLMHVVKSTLKEDTNSLIAFCDNSSVIKGFPIQTLLPQNPGNPSPFEEKTVDYDLLFTAETHNFPTGVAPKPGAETGTGGRIRDTHATGRGSLVVAGTACYCVGNLNIPNYNLPWEDPKLKYPDNLATPLDIEIEASNGASDYGNKFGEPVIQGYTRSFGLVLPNGERREWIKPIMFTGGVGQMSREHLTKGQPEVGMVVTKIGGPAYRIGMGGGSASSLVGGANQSHLDFNAVQRGDAEMGQKLNRVIRACVELGGVNPIVSIHDQGAGGSANVLKEIVEPQGAKLDIRKTLTKGQIQVGDNTMSVLEIWGAEYQEQDALLIRPESQALFESLCQRENLPVAFLGSVTGDGNIVVVDSQDNSTPVDLPLEKVLGKMPAKVFPSNHVETVLAPISIPQEETLQSSLQRVLRNLSVGSKLFLTNKVDRSVTGLIAQQQCVGPLQLPLSNVAVIAQSHFSTTGAAISIGEQPIKGLIDCASMGRMTVGESLTNLVWAPITKLEDVKASGNWMWAAKLPGEGANLWDAAQAMRDMMCTLGIAIDGGKDSLSMAARVPASADRAAELVKSPGTLVISNYVSCPDITNVITPDIKKAGQSNILFVDLSGGKNRLGGSALAQVYGQVGDVSPDVENVELLINAFNTTQKLIQQKLISSGHDRSDGGLITTLLEMAFAGNCGLDLTFNNLNSKSQLMDVLSVFYSEELGLVYEVTDANLAAVEKVLRESNVTYVNLGRTVVEGQILFKDAEGKVLLQDKTAKLRDDWNETSHRLELLQVNPKCAEEERKVLSTRKGLNFSPLQNFQLPSIYKSVDGVRPRIAVLRQEGSNGDREMTSAFFQAGFECWDINMSDLSSGKVTLDRFRGVAFVGGFSYADVMDSAKGWAGVIRYDDRLSGQFQHFLKRQDTFSLGVCNGCQLASLLGWVPFPDTDLSVDQPRFIDNVSGRFESRFLSIKVRQSPSVLLRGLEGATLGVWSSHGSGQLRATPEVLNKIKSLDLAPLRYVDDQGEETTSYPHNPNGSVEGIAGLCSNNGRHLAMMPHPERSFLQWQYPYLPEQWKSSGVETTYSPWFKMFQNAYNFCMEQQQ